MEETLTSRKSEAGAGVGTDKTEEIKTLVALLRSMSPSFTGAPERMT